MISMNAPLVRSSGAPLERRIGWTVILILAAIAALIPASSKAGDLADDYRIVVERRQQLEDRRGEYEKQQNILGGRQKTLTILFYQCVSRRDRAYWEQKITQADESMKKLEGVRLDLDKLRDDIAKTRQGLEKRRQDIESRHTNKTAGTPYEAEFREYMAALEKDVFQRVEAELFPASQNYITEMNAYNDFLKESVSVCVKPKGD